MAILFSLLSGLIFGVGLIISGMTNPSKILGFLDITGKWDPSLAFVMGGALAVGFFAFKLADKQTISLLGLDMKLPKAHHIDRRLVIGSTLFGIGWGIAGFCPGPAVVSLGMGETKAIIFVAAMLSGMGIFELLERRALRRLVDMFKGTS
jgi:uncharacterized protein